jgi:hypothetical protein
MSKYTLKTATIKTVEGITLHGLTPSDAVQLFQLHRPAMETFFSKFTGRDLQDISETELKDVALNLVESTPGFVAHIIALSAHAIEDFDEITNFPIGAQMEALERINELTFEGIAPKKFFGLVSTMFNKTVGPKALPQ